MPTTNGDGPEGNRAQARARRLADEALRLASRCETDGERRAFLEIARMWEWLAQQPDPPEADEPPRSGKG